jgi:thymidylate synthase (FAD)
VEVKLVACPRLTKEYPLVNGLNEVDSIVAYAVSKCYRSQPNPRAMRRCFDQGHTSVFEHIGFTFEINGISRACLAQLTRHRIASYSVESQRYINYTKKEAGVVVPPGDDFTEAYDHAFKAYRDMVRKGIPPEDARFVLPQGVATNLIMTMNARSLYNFFSLRMDKHAQWEIRELAEKMLALVKEVAPVTFEGVVING